MPAGAGPRFRCDQATFTFPDAWDGDKIEHAFVIHNDGSAPLEILAVQPTCGCTLARQYDKTITPGGQGRIEATLDTAGRSGEVVKQINITTNDPASTRVVLTFTGKVRTRISIDPPNGLMWGRFTPEMPLTRTIKLVNNTPSVMKVEPVPASQPSVFAATVKELEPGKVVEVTVTAKPPFVEGLNNAPLKLKTGMKEVPELSVPCYLFVPPVVEISPSWLTVRTPLAQETRRTVLVRYNGEGAMKIESITPSDPAIKTQVTEPTTGMAFNIAVTLPAGLDVSPGKPGSIVLVTNLKDKPAITIDIRPAAALTTSQPSLVR